MIIKNDLQYRIGDVRLDRLLVMGNIGYSDNLFMAIYKKEDTTDPNIPVYISLSGEQWKVEFANRIRGHIKLTNANMCLVFKQRPGRGNKYNISLDIPRGILAYNDPNYKITEILKSLSTTVADWRAQNYPIATKVLCSSLFADAQKESWTDK